MSNTILVISPHADDVELGCSGYLSRKIQEGSQVIVVLMVCKSEAMLLNGHVPAHSRKFEFDQAMSVLNVQDTEVLYYDSSLDFDLCAVPKSEAVTKIDRLIMKYEPDEILIPVPSFHQEHNYTWEIGIAATRPTKGKLSSVSRVMAYTYPGCEWGDSAGFDRMRGALFVDITEVMDQKIACLKAHESQFINKSEQDLISIEGILNQSRYYGMQIGVTYAEMLYVLREIY